MYPGFGKHFRVFTKIIIDRGLFFFRVPKLWLICSGLSATQNGADPFKSSKPRSMRKLIILFLAAGLFIACNNDKKSDRRSDRDTERNQDDYNSDDKDSKDRDSKEADYQDDRDSRDKEEVSDRDDNDSGNGGWPASSVKVFVDNCADEAVRKGMQRSKAVDYCECMQRKLEILYPNEADVANLDVNAPNIKAMIEKCLE